MPAQIRARGRIVRPVREHVLPRLAFQNPRGPGAQKKPRLNQGNISLDYIF